MSYYKINAMDEGNGELRLYDIYDVYDDQT